MQTIDHIVWLKVQKSFSDSNICDLEPLTILGKWTRYWIACEEPRFRHIARKPIFYNMPILPNWPLVC